MRTHNTRLRFVVLVASALAICQTLLGGSISAPSTVPSGQSYSVSATGTGQYPSISIYKNGSYFAAGYMSCSGTSTDTGPSTVYYQANFWAYDLSSWTTPASTSVSITGPNRSPQAGVSGPGYLQLSSSGSVTASFNISCDDDDGNLYRWRFWISPNVSQWTYVSASQSVTFDWTFTSAGTYTFNVDAEDSSGASDSSSLTIIVEDAPPPTYYLSVTKGSGDGYYAENKSADISADSADAGYEFNGWTRTSGPGILFDSWLRNASFVMGAGAASVEATYTEITSYLTVQNGTGSGYYAAGSIVSISANPPPAGMHFTGWSLVSGPGGFSDDDDPTTGFYTGLGDATIKANYAVTTYHLTVEEGSGSGDYAPDQVVDVVARNATSVEAFDRWTVSGPGTIRSPLSMLTKFTMGEANATLTANYIPRYLLTVVDGTVYSQASGWYIPGTDVVIKAVEKPGKQFDHWGLAGPGTVLSPGAASGGFITGAGNATLTAYFINTTLSVEPGRIVPAAGPITISGRLKDSGSSLARFVFEVQFPAAGIWQSIGSVLVPLGEEADSTRSIVWNPSPSLAGGVYSLRIRGENQNGDTVVTSGVAFVSPDVDVTEDGLPDACTADADNDGFSDFLELMLNTNPLDATDTPSGEQRSFEYDRRGQISKVPGSEYIIDEEQNIKGVEPR